jgi:dihydroorotate dehydrogenase electron transfer subunit
VTPANGPAPPLVPPCAVAARVESNRPVVPGIFELTLALPACWGPAEPGQFVQLGCPPHEAFGLRRPFSLAGCRGIDGGVETRIVYGIVGTRTNGLAQVREGALLPLIGPLGRPFRPVPGRRAVLLGGGRGLAPVLMLAKRVAQGVRSVDGATGGALAAPGTAAPLLLHGARTAVQLLPLPDPPCEVRLATDDGTAGYGGTLVDLVQSLLEAGELREGRDALYACGPNRMLAALARWIGGRDLPCQVSLETHFGCGVGICAGCAVPVKPASGLEASAFDRFAFLCREGPVMDAGRVDWEGVPE